MAVMSMGWSLHTADLRQLEPSWLDDESALRELLYRTVQHEGLHPGMSLFHHFTPQGVSATIVSAGLRIALHSWPEHRAATLDVWCRGLDGSAIIARLSSVLALPLTSSAPALSPAV